MSTNSCKVNAKLNTKVRTRTNKRYKLYEVSIIKWQYQKYNINKDKVSIHTILDYQVK